MNLSITNLKASGNSMAPFLLDGDHITIKQVAFSRLQVDDIVSFFKKKELINHRIVYTNRSSAKPYIITKGDFNLKDDGKIFAKQVLGKVVRVHRHDRSFAITSLYQFNAYHYLQEINFFLNILKRNKTDYIILKGLPLYLHLNKKIPSRIFADCDILIKPDSFKRVYKILIKNGYLPEYAVTDFSKKIPELSFYKIIDYFKISFDIHTEPCFMMTKLSKLDMLYPAADIANITKAFFDKKIRVEIAGKFYSFLSPADQFVYLFLHLFHHNFRGYNRYHLISQLLIKKKVDYGKSWNFIRKYNLENYILPGVRIYKRHYPLPQTFNDILLSRPNAKQTSSLNKINIFEVRNSLDESIERFVNLFYLSPAPFYKKFMVIFQEEVLKSLTRVITRKMIIYFRSIFFLLKTSESSHNLPLPR